MVAATPMNAGQYLGQMRTARLLRAKADKVLAAIAGQEPTFTDERDVPLARIRPEFGDVQLFVPLMDLRQAVKFARWVLDVREQVRQSSRRVRPA